MKECDMGVFENLAQRRFARLTVLYRADPPQPTSWWCRCDCGQELRVLAAHLRTGNTKSCGCYNRDVLLAHFTKHGAVGTPTYRIWKAMRARCNNPNTKAYPDYGGRGITVCKRWDKFENFLADMGERPAGMTIERKKNEQGYKPSNCVWASRNMQNRNSRANVWLTVKGETLLLVDWARRIGCSKSSIRARLQRGWSVEDACTRPPRPVRRTGKVIHISSVNEG